MGRYFISNLTCASALFISLLLTVPVHASQGAQPSFDCRKAASRAEKTICADAALARLDSQMGRTWKRLLDAFDTEDAQQTQMKQDQRAWMARRDQCADADCIGKLYRARLSALDGTEPAHRFSGLYEVKEGFFALYPIGDRYLVHIQSAEPHDGRWECDLNGEADASGDDLRVNVEGTVFPAHLGDTKTLVVGDGASVYKAASMFCGLNGTFAFSYLRVRLDVEAQKIRLTHP